jgi:glutathione S-transferase
MKLYFSALACSMAARIALYEAAADADFEQVDGKTKRTSGGQDFLRVHGLGLVPVLELAGGFVISENAAVLQHIAGAFPAARLAPTDPEGGARLQQWLCFIGTELHKALFIPLLDRQAPPEAKDYALSKAHSRLSFLAEQLGGRQYLLDQFSVADAYLFTILNWASVTPVDLTPWPTLVAYQARLRERPSVARALQEELALYRAEKSQPGPKSTAQVIELFNAAFSRHEPKLLDELVDDSCVIESTTPAPLGSRHVGGAACLELWHGIASNASAHFEIESVDVSGERAQIRWQYFWGTGEKDSLRGVNLMRVRNGKIVEALGYVKGA